MKPEEILKIADNNNAEKQMDHKQYDCLVELIADGTIDSVKKLSEYMHIAN